MTDDEIRATVLRLLSEIAPEMEASTIAPDVAFRDQVDIDSMDFLNFAIAVHHSFAVEIPESDYRKLETLDGCVDYLRAAAA